MRLARIRHELAFGVHRSRKLDQFPAVCDRYVPVGFAVQLDRRRQMLDLVSHRFGHAGIEHPERGNALVSGGSIGGDEAAERKAQQADTPGAVGATENGRDGSGHRIRPAVEAGRVIGLAAFLRARLGIECRGVAVRHVAEKIGIDACGRQRVGVALIGASSQLDAARAVQHDHGRPLSGRACGIAGHREAVTSGGDAELFAWRAMRDGGQQHRGQARQRCSAGDHRRAHFRMRWIGCMMCWRRNFDTRPVQ